jgi:hypothetical protein
MEGRDMWWEVLTAGVLVAGAGAYVVWLAHRSLRRRHSCGNCGAAPDEDPGSSGKRLYQLEVRQCCGRPEERGDASGKK